MVDVGGRAYRRCRCDGGAALSVSKEPYCDGTSSLAGRGTGFALVRPAGPGAAGHRQGALCSRLTGAESVGMESLSHRHRLATRAHPAVMGACGPPVRSGRFVAPEPRSQTRLILSTPRRKRDSGPTGTHHRTALCHSSGRRPRRKAAAALPVLMLLLAVALSFIPGFPEIHIAPELILPLFLPPLLYATAQRSSWAVFRSAGAPSVAGGGPRGGDHGGGGRGGLADDRQHRPPRGHRARRRHGATRPGGGGIRCRARPHAAAADHGAAERGPVQRCRGHRDLPDSCRGGAVRRRDRRGTAAPVPAGRCHRRRARAS